MAHFKMLVIGNLDQLDPYDENLELEPYIDPDWDYDEELKAAREYFRSQEGSGVDLDDPYDVLSRWTNDELRWNEDRTHAEQWITYNRNGKWDYWTVGGRWRGAFNIKPTADPTDYAPSAVHAPDYPGQTLADQAHKRAIDFDAMRRRAAKDAERDWEEYERATDGLQPPEHTFHQLRELHGLEKARGIYSSHPWVRAVRKIDPWADSDYFEAGADDPRAAFIAKHELNAVAGFYGVVHEGEWVDMRDDEWRDEGEAAWRKHVQAVIDGLPDDALLTVVDCHR